MAFTVYGFKKTRMPKDSQGRMYPGPRAGQSHNIQESAGSRDEAERRALAMVEDDRADSAWFEEV